MQFKASPYRKGKPELIRHIKRNGDNFNVISFYCATTGFPVAAALVFCLEEWPERRQELEQRLERIKEFYGYEAITE